MAKHLALNTNTVQLLSSLAVTALQILDNQADIVSTLRHALPIIVSDGYIEGWGMLGTIVLTLPKPNSNTSNSNSLDAIAQCILKCEERGIGLDFEMSINLVRFVLKLEHIQETSQEELYRIEVIRQEGARSGRFTEHQGKRWVDWGYWLARFAGAGK